MHNRRRRLARKNTRSASFGCIKRIIGSSSLKPHNVALIPISFEECCQQNFRVAALPVPMLRGSWTCLQGQLGRRIYGKILETGDHDADMEHWLK
ncbi:uncharacterized protein LOC126409222 isoform X4 [Nymphaea colorata]|nr:uncharacterized protein LOC126409222 isoform X4 [Nymphaea colorata]